MRRGETKSIAELVRATCREEGIETPLNEYRLMQAWYKVLGTAVTAFTKELKIRNQVLYVSLTSSVVRHELMMNRRSLVQKLNNAVGAQVITDIQCR